MRDPVHCLVTVFNLIVVLAVVGAVLSMCMSVKTTRALRVMAPLRPLLILGVVCFCAGTYEICMSSLLPCWQLASTIRAICVFIATALLVNVLWNYALCVCIEPSCVEAEVHPLQGFTAASFRCSLCDRRIFTPDHHCPLTGGCIGEHNFRFFALFVLHAWLASAVAMVVSWRVSWKQLISIPGPPVAS